MRRTYCVTGIGRQDLCGGKVANLYTFYGPFPSFAKAIDFHQQLVDSEDFIVMEMTKPSDPAALNRLAPKQGDGA